MGLNTEDEPGGCWNAGLDVMALAGVFCMLVGIAEEIMNLFRWE